MTKKELWLNNSYKIYDDIEIKYMDEDDFQMALNDYESQIIKLIDDELAILLFKLEINQEDNYDYGANITKEKIMLLQKLRKKIIEGVEK